jgi:hypothetical protein
LFSHPYKRRLELDDAGHWDPPTAVVIGGAESRKLGCEARFAHASATDDRYDSMPPQQPAKRIKLALTSDKAENR